MGFGRVSDANAPDVFGLMTILRLRRVSISSVSFSICRKLWSGKFCSSGVGFSMAVPRKEFYKNCPGNCPEKNVPTRLFRQDKSASRGHETSSGFIVNQLWNGAKVNACMLIAVGLETVYLRSRSGRAGDLVRVDVFARGASTESAAPNRFPVS